MKSFLFLIFIFTYFQLNAVWVSIDTTFTYPTSVSINNARTQSKQKLRLALIEKALPVNVKVAGFMENYESSEGDEEFHKSMFIQTGSSGLILKEQVLLDEIQLGKEYYKHHFSMKAFVENQDLERDPELRLDLNLNKKFFHAGDEIEISASPTKSGYLYLFYFLPDHTVMLLYPNSISNDNFLEVNKTTDLTSGYEFIANTDSNNETVFGTLYAVFSIKKIDQLDEFVKLKEGLPVFSAGEESYTLFNNWLSKIPTKLRCEKLKKIQIEGK
jgi:hypothetical protein